MSRSPNVIVPVFVRRLTPVPPDPVTDVFAKLSARLEVLTLMPIPVGLVTVVEPVVKLPPTVVRLIPVVALFVEERLPNVAAGDSVPFVRFNVCPLPLSVTSEIAAVPKANTAAASTARKVCLERSLTGL